MRGFWPLDLDLRAWIRSARDLIVAIYFGSGGQGGSGVRGAAALSPELCSAADGRRRKPNPVFPGSIRVAVWLWSTAPAWVVH